MYNIENIKSKYSRKDNINIYIVFPWLLLFNVFGRKILNKYGMEKLLLLLLLLLILLVQ